MTTIIRRNLDLPFTPAGDLGQGYKKGYETYDGVAESPNSGSPALSRSTGSNIDKDTLRMKSSRDSLLELKSSAFKRFNALPGPFHGPSPLPLSLGGMMMDMEDVSPLPTPFDFDGSPSQGQDTGFTGISQRKQFDPVWGNLDQNRQHIMDDSDSEPLSAETSPEQLDFKSGLNTDGSMLCLDSDIMPQNKYDDEYQDFKISADNIRKLMTRPILQAHDTPVVQPMAAGLQESSRIHSSNKLEEPMSGTRSPYVLIKRRRVGYQDPEEEQMDIHEDPITALDQLPESRSQGEEIKSALERSEEQLEYIGDFSQCHSLPLTSGKHQDLKSITADTMAALLNGHYDHVVQSFSIIDCRYPYEFEGGHIKGAQNIYMKNILMEQFLVPGAIPGSPQDSGKRNILVFHCEFSSERGPKMARFLRSQDRDANQDRYPNLHYPEVYLLDQGYKEFFQHHRDLCTPSGYLPMLHEAYGDDLKHFRAKSKSWAGQTRHSKVKDDRAAGRRNGRSRVFGDIPEQQRRLSYKC